MVQII